LRFQDSALNPEAFTSRPDLPTFSQIAPAEPLTADSAARRLSHRRANSQSFVEIARAGVSREGASIGSRPRESRGFSARVTRYPEIRNNGATGMKRNRSRWNWFVQKALTSAATTRRGPQRRKKGIERQRAATTQERKDRTECRDGATRAATTQERKDRTECRNGARTEKAGTEAAIARRARAGQRKTAGPLAKAGRPESREDYFFTSPRVW